MTNFGASTEVSEESASGLTREIYQDMRRCFDAPIVNLIYRRIAADPATLGWVWGTLRPIIVSGELERRAAELLGALDQSEPSPISADQLRSVGIDDESLSTIRRVLDTYNRTNPMNLIAAKMVELALDDRREATPFSGEMVAHHGNTPVSLPPMIDVTQMQSKAQSAMLRLARAASRGSSDIVPSLFRHFGDWPGFIELAAASIHPLTHGSAMAGLVEELGRGAGVAASRLSEAATVPRDGLPAPIGPARDDLYALLRLFPNPICGMILIGFWLRRALPS